MVYGKQHLARTRYNEMKYDSEAKTNNGTSSKVESEEEVGTEQWMSKMSRDVSMSKQYSYTPPHSKKLDWVNR